MNDNKNYLSLGNIINVIKNISNNKTNAMQTEVFCSIFGINNINATTINNYCIGIRAIALEYKKIYIDLNNKYQKDNHNSPVLVFLSDTQEHCDTVDLLNILNSANNLNRVRLIGVNWNLEDTALLERIYKMSGIDKNGYNIDKSVLTGKVHVPLIRQQQLYDYQAVWPDLEIVFDTMVEQFAVTFKNDDGTVTVKSKMALGTICP